MRFIDQFEHPLIRAYIDVGNMVHYGIPQHWIRKVGKRIEKIHLKDYSRQSRQFVNLGDGDVNWQEVSKALLEIGYTGTVTVEFWGTPLQALQEPGSFTYLKDLSRRIDQVLDLAG